MDSCAITGAAEKTKEAAFECVMVSSPEAWANAFKVMTFICLVLFFVRLVWQAVDQRNKGAADWADVFEITNKQMMLIVFVVGFLVWL